MKKLTKAEEELMQLFWSYGQSSVSNLIEKFHDPKPPHSTISTIVRVLEKKGFIGHRSSGRSYEYYALISKKEYSKQTIKDMLLNYFEGSTKNLVSFLVKEENVNPTELRKLLDDFENNK